MSQFTRLISSAKGGLLITIVLNALILLYFLLPFPRNFLELSKYTVKVFDREDRLLMEFTPENSGFSEAVPLSNVSETLIDLLLFEEDRRFYNHIGVSPRAMVRAMWQNVRSGRIVSGGSTISQQLVKLKWEINRNNILTKIPELFRAVKLEIHYSKDEILEAYLNHVFLGNRIYGIGKAAEIYFGKNPQDLTLLESACLIEMISAPSLLNLYDNRSETIRRGRELLIRALSNQIITAEQYDTTAEEVLNVETIEIDTHAPHFCLWAVETAEELVPRKAVIAEIHTTLDLELYQSCLDITRDRAKLLASRNAGQSSILMIDNRSMEILVMLGSTDFFTNEGQINGVTSLIQPGSTMKPFNYALALESGLYTAATIIPDIYSVYNAQIGKYIPHNYDLKYHGPVRLAVALGSSYNVCAVNVLNDMGLYPYYSFLKDIGFDSLDHPSRFYGLGLTLGNADITLYELVRGYAVFPNGGICRDLKGIYYVTTTDGKVYFPEEPESDPEPVLSAETAFLISHILSEFEYKTPAFGVNSPLNMPFPIAVKTGTSKDYQDNTLVAYTPRYTLGIWTGNFSGAPMTDLPSSSGAGLIFRDIVVHLYNSGYNLSEEFSTEGLDITTRQICPLSGMLAGPECNAEWEYFTAGTEPTEVCDWHVDGEVILPDTYEDWIITHRKEDVYSAQNSAGLSIIHPQNGDIYKIDSDVAIEHQKITLKAKSESDNVNWYLNDEPIGEGKTLLWQLIEGTHTITAEIEMEDGEIQSDGISIVVVD